MITKEYIAQAVDPKTKHVMYQSANKDKKVLETWFKEKAMSGKFAGLEPHIHHRYLVNGRVFHIEQKHILWALIITLASFNVWLIAHG